jgi:hypothetical protein
MLSIGDEPEDAVVAGVFHGNEPVGLRTMIVLARAVSEAPELRAGLTWRFVLVDPDAARLNRWYTKPLTVASYHRGFYRPPEDNQPGFAFPVSEGPHRFNRPLPETWALKRVLDQARPRPPSRSRT